MSFDQYIPTLAIQKAVRGRETEVLQALNIPWGDGAMHLTCPYPDHADEHPSWRWDGKKNRAYCTCIDRSHSIFDVMMRRESLDFETAKLRVAEILGRHDLIKARHRERYQTMDAASLLRPPVDQRDDDLVGAYLAHRLGVAAPDVPLPSTPAVGWPALPYYDPPAKSEDNAHLVGRYPCVVFGTVSPEGQVHAQRVYVKADGKGKADLGVAPDGQQRDAKKSAKLPRGASAAGCAVLWGDPATAAHLILGRRARDHGRTRSGAQG